MKKVSPSDFYKALKDEGVTYYTGVPDSLLKEFCAFIADNTCEQNHIISANEGQSIALATGYYLAQKKIPLVYMQNSGLGNAVNPLMSLAHSQVYSIPMLILIGWRGEPSVKDEPQHMIMGSCMLDMINSMKFNSIILSKDEFQTEIKKGYNLALQNQEPVFLVITKDYFQQYEVINKNRIQLNKYELNREQALEVILQNIHEGIFVGTTGFLSRELCELREKLGQNSNMDFFTVGSMGYASSIALGIALNSQNKNVYCFDGDGAAIMHMGSMCIIGQSKANNLVHFIFNNECHDSVGQQPTCANEISFPQIAKGAGYEEVYQVQGKTELINVINLIQIKQKKYTKPVLIEIKINPGARPNLGRPKQSTIQNKNELMNYIQIQQ
ncbi:phosphonopyruvate decarboxylase, putative [Ichthyophthirius multifiliis]|uniref:Phosphonopyruvate decarboxylase, putative n=1 Tax=Ichthyophthirius multifiliis TaxID=5932 RepID=G0QRX4_ICHMU|nr:phosphonopyruvate decarboxylase, putative [Ichthyophthirius multifiliis]EGR32004.1 phosphonopyruvate decarboxylase, putative [Ichthyophthirius multifiliis]|eukprot:XP_004035490.1 phosphonopyruvate decarboxylase, putative [Ichthyophthirius multifiliis]